jgi:hypothetical protein
MKRFIGLVLQSGLVLTAVAAILIAVRIILHEVIGIGTWYWGGAVAAFIGPVAFAAALFLFERCITSGAPESPHA